MTVNDLDLLRAFARDQSQDAFTALVQRHLDLVYCAALRQVRSPQLAEDVAQSVFTDLARNAAGLKPDTILTAWLYQVTRRTAIDAVRREARRQLREQIASEMNAMNATAADWTQIEPLLDEAMHALDDTDRTAVLLRYFENKSLREVGETLGTSDDAARKRVNRAVERLREFFSKRGVTVGVSGLVLVISANAVQAAPVGLTVTISAAAATASLTNATVITMQWLNAKLVAGIIALAAIGGVGTFLVQQKVAQTPSGGFVAAAPRPVTALPIKLANNAFAGKGDDRFFIGVDPLTKRTNGSSAAGHIKSLIDPVGPDSPNYLRLRPSRFARVAVTKDSPLFGKRVRFTGWLKTTEVDNWAGLGLMIQNPAGKIIAVDEMMDRPIRGTTEWNQYEMVADVPAEICSIDFGAMVYGTGELWSDDFQIDVVSTNTPITDDRRWHKWSPNAADYSVALDPDNTRDGHPTLCLAYTPRGPAPRGSWMWWGQCIREPEMYAGRTVRMTVWIKSEGTSGNAGINLRPKGPNFQLIAEDDRSLRRPLRGTVDWTERSIICAIPKETQCFDTGFYFNGKGKVWIDMESLRYDIIDDEPPDPAK